MSRRRIHVPNRIFDARRPAMESVPLESEAREPGIVELRESPSPLIVEPASADRMHGDWECQVAIARRHAAIVLAGPADERDNRLDACRLVWLHYAAAFGAGVSAQARFADELQDVTRALIKEQQRQDRAAHHRADVSQVAAPIITIEELRPLLRQIMRQ